MRYLRFSAKFLQPQTLGIVERGTQPLVKEIHPGFIGPDGRLEGEDEELAKAVEHADALTGNG